MNNDYMTTLQQPFPVQDSYPSLFEQFTKANILYS